MQQPRLPSKVERLIMRVSRSNVSCILVIRVRNLMLLNEHVSAYKFKSLFFVVHSHVDWFNYE